MRLVLFAEIIGYFGVIWLLAGWYVRGELTEKRFALYSVTPLTIIMITAVFYGYLSSQYLFGLVVGIIAVIVCSIVGYAIARWLYKQFSQRK